MWNKHRLHFLTSLLLACTVLVSCHSKKNLATGKPIRSLSTSRIIDSVMKHRMVPDYFSTKLAVDAEWTDDGQSFKVNVRMRKDSIIWAQVQKLIIVAQAIVTRDSVKVLNKLNDSLIEQSISYLSEVLNADMDYYMLQDLVLGNPMSFDEEDKFKSPADTGFYYLSSHRKGKIRRAITHDRAPRRNPVIYQYRFYPQTFKTYQVNITDMDDSTSLDIKYPAYELIDSMLVPAAMEVEAVKGIRKVKLSIKYSRTKVNEKTDFPFKR